MAGRRLPRFLHPRGLYDLGRRDEADKILFLCSTRLRRIVEGWRQRHEQRLEAWDGTPWGYEGFLTDGYYTMLAVLVREGRVTVMPAP